VIAGMYVPGDSLRRHEPPSESGNHPGGLPWRGYRACTTGTSPVHDRYMTGSTRSSPCEGIPGNPCGMTPPLAQRPDPRAASLTTAPCESSTHRRAGGAPGHRLRGSPRRVGAARCGSLPRPWVRTRRMRGMHQSGEQSGWPRNGTKRARIGKASGSTDRSFGPDAVRYMSVTTATP
jgi:hypothetical protein